MSLVGQAPLACALHYVMNEYLQGTLINQTELDDQYPGDHL